MADYLKYFAPITISGANAWGSMDNNEVITKNALVNQSTNAGGTGNGGKFVLLDANGKLSDAMLPDLAISNITVGTTQPATGSVQTGDVFVNTTENKSYIYTGSQWQELLTPTDAVLSVNGKTGTVSLTAADVSAIATSAIKTTISSSSLDTEVPSAKSVYTFVNTNYAAKSHTHTSANISDSISAGTGITSSETKLVQAKAVQGYVTALGYQTAAQVSTLISDAGATWTVGTSAWDDTGDGYVSVTYLKNALNNYDNDVLTTVQGMLDSQTHVSANITDSISAGTGITSSETKLVQAKAVQAYVATQISGLNLGSTYVAIADGLTAGTGITSTATGWASGKAVYEYVASAITALNLANTYAAKSHTHTVSEISDWSDKFGAGLSVNASTKAVTLSAATASALGGVIVTTGNGLTYSSNKLSMALANGTTAGAVKQGTGITITSGAVAVNFSTDISADASSDIKAATPKAVKSYVDAATSVDSGVGTITGDGTKKKFSVAHSFGADVLVQVVNSDGETVYVPVTRAAAKVDVEFATAPANGTTFKVYIRKVATTALTVS